MVLPKKQKAPTKEELKVDLAGLIKQTEEEINELKIRTGIETEKPKKPEIDKNKFDKFKARIEKWDLILTELYKDIKFLHDEFAAVHQALTKLEGDYEGLD